MVRVFSAMGLLLRLPQVWLMIVGMAVVVLATYWQPIMDIVTYAAWRFAQ